MAFASLTGVVVLSTGLATLNPWTFAPLHRLVFFLRPMVLLFLAAQRLGEGLVQVKPVCASLLCLIVGLAISNYFFVFPVVTETSSSTQLMDMRLILFSYTFAIIGEGAFMMLTLSLMLNVAPPQRHQAVEPASTIQRDLLATEASNAEAMQRTGERIRALENALANEPANKELSPAGKRLIDQATELVLTHIGKGSFGPGELAAELGVSEKTLGRRLNSAPDLTPAAFTRKVRLSFARDLVLLRQYETVAEIAYAAGFASVSHFSKLYREEFGETPKATLKSSSAHIEAGSQTDTQDTRR